MSKVTEAYNFIKKENMAQVFSCEFCKIFKNTSFTEHFRATASACCTKALFSFHIINQNIL